MSETIRIAIGTEPRTLIAQKVLEFSILKNTKSKVKFFSLLGKDYYDRGDFGEGTGFSLLRFSVPELFNYEGRAIYLDSDMLVLSDIKELWNIGNDDLNNCLWCTFGNEGKNLAETSVMVINCWNAKNKIKTAAEIKQYLQNDPERKKYREIMKVQYLTPPPKKLSRWWNVMDTRNSNTNTNDFFSNKAKLIHFTRVPNQPWFFPEHPAASIWGKWLKKAFLEKYITVKELKIAVKKYDVTNKRRPNGINKFWLEYLGI